jgi:hypothetical protein
MRAERISAAKAYYRKPTITLITCLEEPLTIHVLMMEEAENSAYSNPHSSL